MVHVGARRRDFVGTLRPGVRAVGRTCARWRSHDVRVILAPKGDGPIGVQSPIDATRSIAGADIGAVVARPR